MLTGKYEVNHCLCFLFYTLMLVISVHYKIVYTPKLCVDILNLLFSNSIFSIERVMIEINYIVRAKESPRCLQTKVFNEF